MRHLLSSLLKTSTLSVLCLIVVIILSTDAWADEGVTEAQLRALIDGVESKPQLDDTTRENLLGAYRSALSYLEVARAERGRVNALREQLADPDAALKRFQQDYEGSETALSDSERLSGQPSVTVDQLDAMLNRLSVEEALLRNRRTEIEERISSLSDAARLNEALLVRRQEWGAILQSEDQELASAAGASLLEAARLRSETAQKARAAEIERIEQELSTQPARLKLVQQQLFWLENLYQEVTVAITDLSGRLEQLREVDMEAVQSRVEKAAQAVTNEHPITRSIANKSVTYVDELQGLLRSEKGVELELADTRHLLERIAADEKRIRERIEQFGLSNVLGEILRRQRVGLPDTKDFQQRSETHQQLISDASLGQYQTQQASRDLNDELGRVEEYVNQILLDMDRVDGPQVRAQIDTLLAQQKDLLERINSAYDTYLNELNTLSLAESAVIQKTRLYRTFLDEQLIWIPSARPLSWRSPLELVGGLAYYMNPGNWASLMRALGQMLERSTFSALLLGAGLILIWLLRKPLIFSIDEHRQRIGKRYTDRFHYSLESLVLALLNALPIPLLVGFLGTKLSQFYQAADFAHGVGVGLRDITLTLFMLLLFMQLARPLGFFERHLQWSIAGLRVVRSHFWWFIPLYSLAMFMVVSSRTLTPELGSSAMEQTAFIVMSVALAVLFFRLAAPDGRVTKPIYSRWPNGWFYRLRYVWYMLLVGTPLCLAVIAGMGYLYTAQHFLERFIWTVWMFLGALVLYDFGRRGLAIEQNKLALKIAREQHKDQRATAEATPEVSPESEVLDLDKIDLQSRQMLLTFISWGVIFGLWLVWADSLPALTALDEVVLWQHSVNIAGETQLDPISLADLTLALILGFVISIASKNLPGVLEIMVLHHLPLDAGSRYAITTIVRYLIIFIGALVIFGMVGFDWSQMQWLVAALGVGLGFGLQEIFANFVSGLIILFERPVRVGDAVTVSDLSGVVSKIRMRATTITDWDRKEIIVPNKSFITEKLVNWSLSDSVTRVKVSIGIAYGSDTKKAYEIIKSVAVNNSLIMKNPAPRLFFMGFGDSSLDFVLFVYVDNLEDRWNAAHELHMEINEAFAKEGIEIPFPQRDIHIRSIVNGIDLTTPGPGQGGSH